MQAAAFFTDLLPPELAALVPRTYAGCLQPRRVLERGEWGRLLSAAFLHADASHLYYNLSSLLWKGVRLEARLGSAAFAGLVAELLLLSHAAVALGAAALAAYAPAAYAYLYYDTCMVGFSAVLFGLKVVLNAGDDSWSEVAGIRLPAKYLCWAELFVASALNPRASFFGHLCGIAAGLAHVHLAAPAASAGAAAWRRASRWLGGAGGNRGASYFSSSGRAGGAPQQQAPVPPRPRPPAEPAPQPAPQAALSEEELRRRRLEALARRR